MQFTGLLIALYARLSKDRAGLSENVQIQLRECEDFVEDSDGTVSLRFNDDDISASKYSTKPRPDYDRLIAAVDRGDVEIIVVTEMTRLYRRLEELLELIKMAERTKLRAIWTTDGIGYDLGTPEGIHAAIAAVNNAMLESAKVSKRTIRKKNARAVAGKNPGGTRSYCYEGPRKDEDGNILNRSRINVELVEHEVAIFKTCVARIITGEYVSTIMYDLNRQGIPAPQGGKWGIGNFKRCLIKMRYVIFDDSDPEQRGTLLYNGREYRAVWPGIITREQHALMLARLAEAVRKPESSYRVHRRFYLLSGQIYCGACGCAMVGSAVERSNGYSQRSYRCRKYDHYRNVIGCGNVYRGADPLEDLVVEAVLAKLEVPEIARALTAQESDDGVSTAVETLATRRQHRTNLVAEYGRGEHDKADYKIMLAAADEAIELAEAEVQKHLSTQAAAQLPTDEALRDVWASASNDWRAEVIKLLVGKIVVLPGHPGSHRYKQWRFNPDRIRIEWKPIGQEVLLSVAALITGERKIVHTLTELGAGTATDLASHPRDSLTLVA